MLGPKLSEVENIDEQVPRQYWQQEIIPGHLVTLLFRRRLRCLTAKGLNRLENACLAQEDACIHDGDASRRSTSPGLLGC